MEMAGDKKKGFFTGQNAIGVDSQKSSSYKQHALFTKYENRHIPEYLCWIYNSTHNKLYFIGNHANFHGVELLTVAGFISKIKACFRSQFIDAVKGYFSMRHNKAIKNNGAMLSLVLPLKLKAEGYMYCKVTIIADNLCNDLENYAVIVIPVKFYAGSNIIISINANGNDDPFLTRELKKFINLPRVRLTEKQRSVLNYLYMGFSAPEIAKELGVVTDSVHKINRRIIEKMSDFFELEFKDAKQAADYYYNSFN